MLGWLLLACVIFVAGKMAEIEGRNPWAWGFATGSGVIVLTTQFGVFLLFSNVIALVGVFLALWIAKYHDDKKAGRPF